MAGSAPDPGAGGGHGWDLGGRERGVERWGKFWRFEEGVVAGQGSRWRRGEARRGEVRGHCERASCLGSGATQGRWVDRPLGTRGPSDRAVELPRPSDPWAVVFAPFFFMVAFFV
jgi:hypothetical protein